jgi:N-acetylglucosamine-6-sulfatase
MPKALRTLCAALALLAAAAAPATAADTRPNVVVLMTDDQTVDDLRAMPQTEALLAAGGVSFSRSYVSYPLCCPSRATYLSGQYAHNHRVLGLYPPTGGYGRFDATESLPVWLQRTGYHTAHIGKYMNGYGTQTSADPPLGWSDWYGDVGESTYRMWGFTLNENGVNHTYGTPFDEDPHLYQTDIVTEKAVDVIDENADSGQPLFLSVAFLAPHHEGTGMRQYSGRLVRAAPRHVGKLALKPLPIPRSFNEYDVSDKPFFLRRRPPLTLDQIDRIERNYRDRQESLLAVDEGVGEIVSALERAGELDNTYLIFTSDNGYLQGEHRVPSGKMLPYDPSTQVPLLLRGPGIPAGQESGALVGNVDLAPTILDVAGAQPGRLLDGFSLMPFARDTSLGTQRALLHETGGRKVVGREQDAAGQPAIKRILSYEAVRTTHWLYVEYKGGARELYDLKADPAELHSRHRDPRYARTLQALRRLLMRLAICAGSDCRAPARAIPPPLHRLPSSADPGTSPSGLARR